MGDLRKLNRAVQSAEYPSHEWAQAVREWIDKATESMEPKLTECPNCKQLTSKSHVKGGYPLPSIYLAPEQWTCQPASEGAKVETEPAGCWTDCPVCDQHFYARPYPKPAQPEPAASVAMPDSGAPDGTPYEIAEAVAKLSRHGEKQEAHNLAGWWMRLRTHAAQPQVAMSPDLEDLLDSIMSFADVDPDTQVKQIWRRKVAAVRAQAAGVKP